MTDDLLPDGWRRVTEIIDPYKVVQHRRTVSYRNGEPWIYEADFRTTPAPEPEPRPSIVHVAQRWKTDCGVAVVAMLAQVSWEEAELAMFPTMPDGSPRRPKAIRTYFTSTEADVRRGIEHFGLTIEPAPEGGIVPSKNTWWDVLYLTKNNFGLLCEQMREDGNWHWVVLEGETGYVWDPAAVSKKPQLWGMRAAPHSFWIVTRSTSLK